MLWNEIYPESISIHALREEGDGGTAITMFIPMIFLSTPSARRATMDTPPRWPQWTNFYPRPPRGGRLGTTPQAFNQRIFLSTPSARRATIMLLRLIRSERDFYPRPPRGGRRRDCLAHTAIIFISIHALREEGDLLLVRLCSYDVLDISIHALREEGDMIAYYNDQDDKFLSTPSARRATESYLLWIQSQQISIHALREEGDWIRGNNETEEEQFLSTPSARRATGPDYRRPAPGSISIHALREEGDVGIEQALGMR